VVNKLSFRSIKFQLFVMVFIMALFAAGIIVYTGVSLRNEEISEAMRDSTMLADGIFNEHEKMVADVRQLMLTLAQLPDIKNLRTAGMQRILKEVLGANPRYSNIVVADRTGRVLASALPARDTTVSDRRYFIKALASGLFSAGEYITSRFTGKPVFVFAYPFKDGQGKILGIIAMGIDLRYYKTLLDTMPLPTGSSYLLLDHKGTIMTRGINPTDFVGDQYDAEAFRSMADGPDKDTFVAVAHDGIKRFISYRKVRLEGEQTPYMYIRAGIPVAAALSVANKTLIRNLTLFALSLGLVVVFISLIAKHSIVDRITLLERASKRLADGDMHFKVSDLVSGGELGRLGLTFDNMARQIASREEALSESKQRYLALFEQSPYGVLLLDTEGKILDFNEAAHRSLGYTREEFSNLTIADIDPLESAAGVKARIGLILEEGRAEFEVRQRTKQGAMRDVSVITKALTLSGRTFLHSIWRDVTEQKRAEGAIHLQSEIARNISEGIYLVSAKDLTIVYANPKMEAMFGYTPGEMNGKHVSIINSPAGEDPVQRAIEIEKTLKESGTWRGEVLNIRKDGTPFWGQASISMLHHPEYGEVYLSLQADITERRMAADALRQSEDKFRALFELANDAIFILDMEGNVIDVNRTAYERLGYTKEEILSMHLSQLDHPDFRETIPQRIEHMQKHGWYQGDLAHLRKDGTVMPVEINARIMDIAGKKVILSSCRDITERKRAEEALRTSEERLNTILDNVGGAIFIKDAQYRYVYVNRKVCEVFGRRAEEIIGKSDRDFFSDGSVEEIMRSDRPVIERGETISREETGLTFSSKEARTYWTVKLPLRDSAGAVTGLCGISTDITERKRAEEVKDRLLKAIAAATEGIAITDDNDRFIYVNDAHAGIYGYHPDELVGKSWRDTVSPDLQRTVEKALEETLHNRAVGIWSGETPARRRDGTVIPTEVTATSRWGEAGTYLGHICIVRDITERKRSEAQIMSALAEKEVLLKEIHHRVKNNLNVIASLLSLQSRYITEPAVVGILEECRHRIKSMALIHEKLYQTRNFSRIDFKEYLNSLISMLSSSYIHRGDNISLVTDIQDLSLDIDTAITCGLITNELVTNCLKHAFPENRGGVISINLFSEEGKRVLTVRDDGIGLPDKFDLTRTNTLGLKMVTMLTKQLEGTLHVAVNNGTEIRIFF
jgi:PAS domain S-box-containing protein